MDSIHTVFILYNVLVHFISNYETNTLAYNILHKQQLLHTRNKQEKLRYTSSVKCSAWQTLAYRRQTRRDDKVRTQTDTTQNHRSLAGGNAGAEG